MNVLGNLREYVFENGLKRIKALLRGRSDVQRPYEISQFGIDGRAPIGYRALVLKTEEKGKTFVVGYINQKQLESLPPGENRIYSVDTDGNVASEIFLRNDGTAEILGNSDFAVRYNVLKTEYDKTKDVLDAVTQVCTGPPINEPGNGSPSAFQAALASALSGKSTGDISGSKIDEIKVP